MPIDLYYMNLSPPSRAVLMTAKQLNLKVNIKQIDLGKGEHLTPEYLKLNPSHTVPTIVDNEFALFESRAIIQYLCNEYAPDSQLYPKEPKKRAVVDRWLNTDASFFMISKDALVLKVLFGSEPTQQAIENLKKTLQLLDNLVGDNKYLAADHLTIADISVLATTTLLSLNDYKDLNECPNLKKWFERLSSELPYFKEINGSVKEDLYQLALALSKK